VVTLRKQAKAGPERTAPARLFLGSALALLSPGWLAPVAAQPRTNAAAPAPAQAPAPVPATAQPAAAAAVDPILVNRLVWSAMAAVNQANQTGNYSVLHDLGAPSFQTGNPVATLSSAFSALRTQQVDLSYTLVLTPTFEFPPTITQAGLLRARGVFPLRPTAIGFDLLFQNIEGQWRIFGLAVIPLVARAQQSGSTRR
jgi:hypothetical protein